MKDLSLIGVGLRQPHFPFLEKQPVLHSNWFEAISENYMNTEGRPLEMLLKIRQDYPVGLHGVSMSVGSDQDLDIIYLKKLKQLIDRVDPIIVSDHICWSRAHTGNTHDLIPLPYTQESLDRIITNVMQAQEEIGRELILENISYYFRYKSSDMTEFDFIKGLCQKTGCKILLDLNNVYVNSVNHSFDPFQYLNQFPLQFVRQIHLAGPTQEEGYLFDTHSTEVPSMVWSLFNYICQREVDVPVIVEWDEIIPDFEKLEIEVIKAQKIKNFKKDSHLESVAF